jgi:hypothetical protein
MAESRIRSFSSKPRGEWFIAAGVLAFVVAELTSHFLPAVDPMTTIKAEFSALLFIRFVGNCGLILALGSTVITGIRSLRREGVAVRGVIMSVLGVSLCIASVWLAVYGSRTFLKAGRALDSLPDGLMEKLEVKLSQKDLPPSELGRWSELYARLRYENDGVLIDYITTDGQITTYEPTEEVRKLREQIVYGRQLAEYGTKAMRRAALLWSSVVVGSLALGLLTPIRTPPDTIQCADKTSDLSI